MRSDEARGSRSLVGYPFTETDMIGGSLSETPRKDVLIRWAGAAALSPMTIGLYRAAIDRHEWLAPYTWSQVQRAGRTGEPITKPLFFDFPGDQAAYPISGQWLLGDAVLAAPVLTNATSRDVYVPRGQWLDVATHRVVHGPCCAPTRRRWARYRPSCASAPAVRPLRGCRPCCLGTRG